MLNEEQERIKRYCFSLAKAETKESREGHHKFSTGEAQSYKLFTRRFNTIIDAYFLIAPKQMYNYESLILPALHIEHSKKVELIRSPDKVAE